MKKSIIVINGSGGVGKDTLCDIAATKYLTMNVSSVTPIKDMATIYAGWTGTKTAKDRKFLSDLKVLCTEYCDLSFKYLIDCVRKFVDSDNEILFVHIREPEEITKFITVASAYNIDCYSLLVSRPNAQTWYNMADDGVNNAEYDLYYCNNKSLEELPNHFLEFLEKSLKE